MHPYALSKLLETSPFKKIYLKPPKKVANVEVDLFLQTFFQSRIISQNKVKLEI